MRIVGGNLKGLQFFAPAKLPVRPTTDMAKEALFNILINRYDFHECSVLDLFSGTGSISIEFASRDIKSILAIDKHPGCVAWLKSVKDKHNLDSISIKKADVFKFLEQTTEKFNIIFADPPYDLPTIPLLPQLVDKQKLLNENGILVVEHPSNLRLQNLPGYVETRKYGYSSFTFFAPIG